MISETHDEKALPLDERLKQLDAQRKELEMQMVTIHQELHQPGMPGLCNSLIDSEGFPKAQYDLYAIRQARHQYYCLETDLKIIQKEIENTLYKIHQTTPTSSQNTSSLTPSPLSNLLTNPNTESEPPYFLNQLVPFLQVDQVFPHSPAEQAGLQVHDLILQFGSLFLTRSEQEITLAQIHQIVQAMPAELELYLDKAVVIRIQRAGQIRFCTLYPKAWDGKGYLGCHVLPYLG